MFATINPYSIPGIPEQKAHINRICRIVCEYYNTDFEYIYQTRGNRKANLVLIRHVIMYLATENGHTEERSGRIFGKNHATSHNSKVKITEWSETNPKLRNDIEAIKNQILSFNY